MLKESRILRCNTASFGDPTFRKIVVPHFSETSSHKKNTELDPAESSTEVYQIIRLFYPTYEGIRKLRNVGKYPSNDMASRPRNLEC